jgi:2-polyprenyl-3-methyl-5-hydroxy-6-metoxy-1,4-benzoquinol methylase
MTKKENIEEFYDQFSELQQQTGVNLRHYQLINELISAGMKPAHTVLEVGCGIGTLTGLIAAYVKKGRIVAADISSKSVEIAQKRLAGKMNVTFEVTDMKGFVYTEPFDFIVLPDVMEHIPVDQHPDLFKTLVKNMHQRSLIFIHIPHPLALDYYREHQPESLQIIDQSLDAEQLVKDASRAGLQLVKYTAYSLFHREHDYVMLHFTLRSAVELHPLSKSHVIRKKLNLRIQWFLKRLFQK